MPTEETDLVGGNYVVMLGDCLVSLRKIKSGLVKTCVTSPPYFGLRDYGHPGQIGLEQTPEDYVAKMVAVFREVRRVLADDGTLWLNIGDSYRKDKQLLGIPWRVAFALQSDGWVLRQDIIWHKPNPMPESVRDRCTKAHEYIFLLSKSERYFFDSEAMKEPVQSNKGNGKSFRGGGNYTGGNAFNNHQMKARDTHGNAPNVDGTRNRRSVWTVATRPYMGAHFATFPPALIEPCILASSRPGDTVLDPFNGSGTTGQVALTHGRKYLGCELNPEYLRLTQQRLTSTLRK